MIHHPKASRPAMPASPEYFSGQVRMDLVIDAASPSRVRAVKVDFAAMARTAWHTHPLGQTLFVLSGTGLAQSWGGPVVVLNEGDTIWFAPGEKHWHGAGPDTAIAHLAIQEALDGRSVDWLEQVSEAQYLGQPT